MLKIVTYPHPSLLKKTTPITVFHDTLKDLTEEMFSLMKANRGIGLAANQVDINQSFFVMEIENEKFVFINPIIISSSTEKIDFEEGCLSFPSMNQTTNRSKTIELSWQDLDGNCHQREFSDLHAICIQHEIEHLNGITFIDHLSSVKKLFAVKKYFKNKNK